LAGADDRGPYTLRRQNVWCSHLLCLLRARR
jgi:hypothetical protein